MGGSERLKGRAVGIRGYRPTCPRGKSPTSRPDQVASFEHPLFGMELPFPFVVFASARSRADLIQAAGQSLAVVVAGGDDDGLMQDLLLEPTIDKVFGSGALSTQFDPREPHEGFLLDFLYQTKAIRSGSIGVT